MHVTQSICSAAGASAIFWAAGLTISTWFQRRRGIASGIATLGSSIGGVVGASLVIPSLFQSSGFGGALRAIAFAYLCFLVLNVIPCIFCSDCALANAKIYKTRTQCLSMATPSFLDMAQTMHPFALTSLPPSPSSTLQQ
ncbi:hypothetical protein VTK56DRAFT_3154 [Thermocarpiscus australiensis]